MANPDRMAFDAMNSAVSSNDSDPLLDFDKRMEDEGLDRGEINRLYSTRYPDVSRNRDQQYHFDTEVLPYWDAETYRELSPKDREARLMEAKTIKGDLMEFSEKKRFKELTGLDASQFEWDQDMRETITRDNMEYSESPFRRKHGFEDWMRDKGYYDETKTSGIVAAIQRLLPGGKEGKSREFADPREDRRVHREIMDNMFKEDSERKDIGEFQKTGNY